MSADVILVTLKCKGKAIETRPWPRSDWEALVALAKEKRCRVQTVINASLKNMVGRPLTRAERRVMA